MYDKYCYSSASSWLLIFQYSDSLLVSFSSSLRADTIDGLAPNSQQEALHRPHLIVCRWRSGPAAITLQDSDADLTWRHLNWAVDSGPPNSTTCHI